MNKFEINFKGGVLKFQALNQQSETCIHWRHFEREKKYFRGALV